MRRDEVLVCWQGVTASSKLRASIFDAAWHIISHGPDVSDEKYTTRRPMVVASEMHQGKVGNACLSVSSYLAGEVCEIVFAARSRHLLLTVGAAQHDQVCIVIL
jgi:hypothetical protein